MNHQVLKFFNFIWLGIGIFSSGFSFEQYLLPISKEHHRLESIQGIDFVYVINLKKRPEKWAKCLEILNQKHIHAQRVEAVDGCLINLQHVAALTPRLNTYFLEECKPGFFDEDLNWWKYDKKKIQELKSQGKKFVYSKINTKGHLGAAYSHLTILKDAIESDYKNVLILEDDFQIEGDLNLIHQLIKEADERLADGYWDIIFLDNWHILENQGIVSLYKKPYLYPNGVSYDLNMKRRVFSISKHLNLIQSRYGLYSMVLSKNGARKLYNYFKANKLFYPIDAEINNIPGIVLLEVKNHLITCDRSISDTSSQK